MNMQQFAQQIEHLLWTGAIEGEEIAKLYHLLKAHEKGKVSAEAMQQVIADIDPDQQCVEPLPEEEPPIL